VLNERSGWAEIRHPFHPLKGQRFAVLKERRVAGTDTLLLRHEERGSFSIAREWTDWGSPSDLEDAGISACRLDANLLLELISLMEQLVPAAPRKT
jgi:hypothetical protein